MALTVEIDKRSGFCGGVIRAISKAEEFLDTHPGKKLYSLGGIVHNEAELERLGRKGLVTIGHDDISNIQSPDNETVLIRAHGEPPSTYELTREAGINLIDCTCPVVLKLQKDIREVYSRLNGGVARSSGSTASLRSAPPLASQSEAPVPPLNVPRVAVVSSSKVPSDTASAPGDNSRRAFLVGSALALGGSALSSVKALAQNETDEPVKIEGEGGFADIVPKVAPKRTVAITPFGSESVKSFYSHCTACQLCVAVCPNNVLRPSKDLKHLMQPEMSFERGYCRPECVKCSEVCPAGAILKITPEEKTQWKVGTAKITPWLCLVDNGTVEECGNCARHCPTGAIQMVRKDPDDPRSVRIPSVDESKCIGCGACENLCPSRPVSAITVDGYQIHHKA